MIPVYCNNYLLFHAFLFSSSPTNPLTLAYTKPLPLLPHAQQSTMQSNQMCMCNMLVQHYYKTVARATKDVYILLHMVPNKTMNTFMRRHTK